MDQRLVDSDTDLGTSGHFSGYKMLFNYFLNDISGQSRFSFLLVDS
jgi:hypothetical protein